GYARPETRPFLTHALPYQPDRHEVEQNVALIAALCACDTGRPGPLWFPVTEAARTWATDWLAVHGIVPERPLIAIHAGAGAAVKQWPPVAWAETARRLMAECDAQILLTGSAAERPLAQAIAAQLTGPVLDATGHTDLEQLAALMARCAAVLGSDSGPLHLAVAVGTPTVHLYGPASVVKFGPWGDPSRHIALKSNWACVPCNRLDWPAADLPQHACVAAISVEDVVGAARSLLIGAARPMNSYRGAS
ncbi:MAG: glycosyltransferase family 9 protein, partial [Anaerolineae bacterium]|nr:glycosyltransferase family 9 protein [Anaerolineae bacterium]